MRRRLRASGLPCRTANTPDFGRGWLIIVATSPAAKTSGWEADWSVSVTRMKPFSSTSRPASAGHDGAAARVTQRISSASISVPEDVLMRPGATSATDSFACT